jgi:hypothetical protein
VNQSSTAVQALVLSSSGTACFTTASTEALGSVTVDCSGGATAGGGHTAAAVHVATPASALAAAALLLPIIVLF